MTITRTASKIRALAAAVVVLTVLGIGAQAASAYTTTASGASPGTASTPYVDAAYASYASGVISTNARTVYESPGYRNYDQYVCLTARLWKLNAPRPQSWSKVTERRECAWIRAAASSATIRNTDFTNLTPYFGYSVDFDITWQLSNGALVGRRNYDYNAVGDYRCLNAKCSKGTSTVGAFVMFDF